MSLDHGLLKYEATTRGEEEKIIDVKVTPPSPHPILQKHSLEQQACDPIPTYQASMISCSSICSCHLPGNTLKCTHNLMAMSKNK